MKSAFVTIIFLLLSFSSCTDPVSSTTFLISGDKLVKDVIGDLQRTAQTLLNGAVQGANSAMAQAGNEVKVLSENLNIMLQDDINLTFDKLDLQSQKVLNEAERFRQEVEKTKGDLFKIENTLSLDLKEMLPWNNLEFNIRKIDGITQLIEENTVPNFNASGAKISLMDNSGNVQEQSDVNLNEIVKLNKPNPTLISYKFNFFGKGFGTNSNEFQSKIKKIVLGEGDKEAELSLDDFTENKIGIFESNLNIATSAINKFIDQNTFNKLKVKIIVSTTKQKGVFFDLLFKKDVTKDYEFEFYISFLPKKIKNILIFYSTVQNDFGTIEGQIADTKKNFPGFAATTHGTDPNGMHVTISMGGIVFEKNIIDSLEASGTRIPNPRTIEYSYTTINHHQDHKPIISFAYEDMKGLNQNERFISFKMNSQPPQGNGCPWTSFDGIDILEDRHLLKARFHTSGQPCTYFYSAVVESKVAIFNDQMNAMDFEYDSIITFDLPKNTKFWRIQGETADFQKINIARRKDFGNLIVFQDEIDLGPRIRVVYKINKPF